MYELSGPGTSPDEREQLRQKFKPAEGASSEVNMSRQTKTLLLPLASDTGTACVSTHALASATGRVRKFVPPANLCRPMRGACPSRRNERQQKQNIRRPQNLVQRISQTIMKTEIVSEHERIRRHHVLDDIGAAPSRKSTPCPCAIQGCWDKSAGLPGASHIHSDMDSPHVSNRILRLPKVQELTGLSRTFNLCANRATQFPEANLARRARRAMAGVRCPGLDRRPGAEALIPCC